MSLKLLRQQLRKKEQKELIDEIADLYKKAIADYEKLSCSDTNLADIMLFYVECGVGFTNEYGDFNERLYNSMASVYVNACPFNLKSPSKPENRLATGTIMRS